MLKIFQNGVEKEIAALLVKDKCEEIYALLSQHKNSREAAQYALDSSPVLDRFQEIHDHLPQPDRRLFCIIADEAFGVSFRDHDKAPNEKHPFVRTFKKTTDTDSDSAQDYLIQLYNKGQKKSFAVALAHYSSVHRYQFVRDLAQNDAFNKHIVIVDRPSGLSQDPYITPLVMIADNSDVAPFLQRQADTLADAPYAPKTPEDYFDDGFEVISSDGVFNSLSKATRHTLADMPASMGYGVYGGKPAASLHYESLVTLHAEILRVIKDNSNYFSNAVQRVQYQKDNCATIYHGGMFGQRFIKEQGYPEWAEAIWNRSPSKLPEDELERLGNTLTRYALFDTMNGSSVSIGGNQSREEYDARQAAFLKGFVRALNEINDDLIELSSFDDRPSSALQRYEATWGFHNDLTILEIGDKKRAAYAHLADIISGAFSFHPVMGSFVRQDDSKNFVLRDEMPIQEIFDGFFEARSHTHIYRMLNFLSNFGKEAYRVFNQQAQQEGVVYFSVRGMKVAAQTGVPENGFSVPACFDGDKAYVMPPFAKMRFIAADDLSVGNATDLRAALNVDYSILALKRVEEKGVSNDAGKSLVRSIVASIKDRADAQIKKVLGVSMPNRNSYFEIVSANKIAQREAKSALADAGLDFSDAAQVANGRTKSKRPPFWRASQLLDLVNKLRPKGTTSPS